MPDSTRSAAAKFITFEGGEGVGKSTQVKRLLTRLGHAGVKAVRTREPGGTAKAEAIRSFILQGRSEEWGVGAEAVLFAAARHDHVTQLIAPNLERGNWVLSDRFSDSTRAYQGLTGGVEPRLIDALEELALDGHVPDLTIILDMAPQQAFQRVAQRALDDGIPNVVDRFEKEDLTWHGRLRDAFLDIAKRDANRCSVISAEQEADAVAEEVWQAVCGHFPEVTRAMTG